MYPDWVSPAVVGVLAVWLGLLSFIIWQQGNFLKSLFPKSGERDIRKKFEELIKTVAGFEGKFSNQSSRLTKIQTEGLQHIQKVALLRFNPYDDTGGDQSFAVCLLDNKGSGVVITSLHARSGTRIFGKEIILGKAGKHQLSKEEEIVIKKAMEDK